ncbi:hypothetical protein QUA13_30070 [Microcoleus sp. S28C3]
MSLGENRVDLEIVDRDAPARYLLRSDLISILSIRIESHRSQPLR